MPNRILKESINESRGLTSCSFFAQDLYKRLITYADDNGRFNADTQIMLARLYPRELAVISQEDLVDGLVELVGVNKIGFYTSTARNEAYGAFPNWSDHQRLRDSKKKAPDPTDTAVNDWYLRRFIPLEMRVAIIERDGFKCQICNKHIANIADAKKAAKMGAGLFHFDHIVPCCQGGRATMENIRLTCPECNLKRKKRFNYDEIINFAASCRKSPQVAASCGLNPIQSESESKPKKNPNPKESECGGYFGAEISDEQAHDHMLLLKRIESEAQKWGIASSPGNLETALSLSSEYTPEWLFKAMERAGNGASKTWHYITGILRSWKEQGKPDEPGSKPANSGKTVSAQSYTQREYTEDQLDQSSGDLFAQVRAARGQ